ncbi:hypothetical protein E2C01_061697 [Portunus trituberculatus]|uniref:HTH psq-type domain-containing protein n=1 Tax=Portunus trituberculatus TaxID=210409 RepID=A0A5B7H5Y4_PORTR|nr:hypothetical protein [Portunus trituberculatus]
MAEITLHQPPRPNPPSVATKTKDEAKVKRARKNLTYAEKWELIKKIDQGMTKRGLATLYRINKSTVRGIYQKKDTIKSHMDIAPTASAAHNAKRSGNRVLVKTE